MASNSKRSLLLKGIFLDAQERRCFGCGCQIKNEMAGKPASEAKKKIRAATWEHVVPLSRGGHNTICNLVLSCSPCNFERGGRMPTEREWQDAHRIIWSVVGLLMGISGASSRRRTLARAALRLVVNNDRSAA